MIDDSKRKGLGRGLAALLGDDTSPEAVSPADRARNVREVPIELLQANRYQPRKHFDDEAMTQLVASVAEKGVLQPILVRKAGGSNYEIIAGERRWRAAQRAGLHQVPVLVREVTDPEALEIALIENLQRQDLNPIEEAEGYRRLMQEFAYSQEQAAQVIGKSRSAVANALRLLNLPASVQGMLQDGRLTAGHARALITATDPEELARRIIDSALNVRQTEALVNEARGQTPARAPHTADPDIVALERGLSAALGLAVKLHHRGDHGGELRIAYKTLEQFDDLLRRLGRPMDRSTSVVEADDSGKIAPFPYGGRSA